MKMLIKLSRLTAKCLTIRGESLQASKQSIAVSFPAIRMES